jgi:hypothetical protein
MSDTDPDKEKQFFVSRRGRQVGLNQVDMSDIDIDSDENDTSAKAVSAKDTEASTPTRVKRTKQPRVRTGWTRKKTIILGIVIALLLIPVLLGELVAAQYRTGVTGAKSDLAKVVNSTVLPAQKKTTITADQIRAYTSDVNDIMSHMCRGGFLDNMAGLYSRAKQALTDCNDAQAKYSTLVSGLYKLEAEARYLEKMSALIKPVSTPITDEYAVIGAQQTAWLAVAEGLKKLSPPEAMNPAHAELVTHVTSVADNWSKLNTANNAQDAAGFTEAEKALASEYEAVRTTSAEFTRVLGDTQAKVTTSYNLLK